MTASLASILFFGVEVQTPRGRRVGIAHHELVVGNAHPTCSQSQKSKLTPH